jgi:hypothetical protein
MSCVTIAHNKARRPRGRSGRGAAFRAKSGTANVPRPPRSFKHASLQAMRVGQQSCGTKSWPLYPAAERRCNARARSRTVARVPRNGRGEAGAQGEFDAAVGCLAGRKCRRQFSTANVDQRHFARVLRDRGGEAERNARSANCWSAAAPPALWGRHPSERYGNAPRAPPPELDIVSCS